MLNAVFCIFQIKYKQNIPKDEYNRQFSGKCNKTFKELRDSLPFSILTYKRAANDLTFGIMKAFKM